MNLRIEGIRVWGGGVADGDGDVVAERGKLVADLTAERASPSRFLKACYDVEEMHEKEV